ncbi:MAG: hypothetical protein KIT54_00120 [Phycisphaeraceae bacterium]|nr:hypothetical protein [Phycisphaeraceae bacterium]
MGVPSDFIQWIELAALPLGTGLALLGIHRWLRRRMLSMAALREAVLASENMEASTSELRLSAQFGPEAGAWNALLERLSRPETHSGRAIDGQAQQDGADGRLALSVCSALWQGVLVVGADMRIRFANPASAMLLGVDGGTLPGRLLSDVMDVGLLQDPNAGLRRGSVEIDRTLGEATARLRVSVRSGRDGDGHVVVVEDVTQLHAAEDARANFIAHATHELRTPLTNMRLYAETALGDDCDEAMLGTCLNVINQEVRRLERVVSDMLSVSEMEAGALSIQEGEARLDQLLDELRLEFEPLAQAKGVRLRFELPPKLPVVKGDRDKLLQAYHNVLGNAIKYTPEGGEVTLAVEAADEGLLVVVRDTGVGIAEQDRTKIFERFYRTDDVRASGTQGTGLGLTLAKEIMLCHEGGIDVDSTPGKGSVFTLSLPRARLVA